MSPSESCRPLIDKRRHARYKRLLDIILALAALLILAPIMLIIALIITGESPGPVIFCHSRLGLGGRLFTVYKFRTMQAGTADPFLSLSGNQRDEFQVNFKLPDDPRVTRIGKVLRRFSLDELPQFWNVLKNEMSIVGPRPITPAELPRYGPDGNLLLSVKPGLTGLWQVSGRNALPYARRIQLDLDYVRQHSLRLDLTILLATFRAICSRKGAC